MGILSGLFRSKDKPADRTAGSSYGSKFFANGGSFGSAGASEVWEYAGAYGREEACISLPAVFFVPDILFGWYNKQDIQLSCCVCYDMDGA